MTMDANFTQALKQRYPDWAIQKLVYTNRPLLALLPKFEDAVGDVIKFPLMYGDVQNTSADFATALAGTSGVQMSSFLVTRKRNYSLATLDNETVEASKNNAGAFLQYLETSMGSAMNSLSNQIAMQLYRDGSGAVGVHASESGAGPTTVTLGDANDIVNFEVGMQVQAWPVGGAVRAEVGTISAVDRENGTFTCAQNLAAWTAGDQISVKGNKDAVLSGLGAWIPTGAGRAAALAAPFFGVTRSADTARLGGVYLDKSASPIEEGIVDGLNKAIQIGDGNFDVLMVNPMDFSTLEKALGSKVQRVQMSTEIKEGSIVRGVVGFNALEIYYAGGSVKVVADRFCPKGFAYALTLESLKFCSLGNAVRIFDQDGRPVLRSATADALQFRVFSYSNLYCTAPGKNAILKIA
jgi:hypothetical protein